MTWKQLTPRLAVGLLVGGLVFHLFSLLSPETVVSLKRVYRMAGQPARERTAQLFLGGRGAEYVRFLRQEIQEGAGVILTPGYPVGHAGVMAHFLMPRLVFACPSPDSFPSCVTEHLKQATHVLATRGFTLDGQPEALTFVPFENANWEYQGFYDSGRSRVKAAYQVPLLPKGIAWEGLGGLLLILMWTAAGSFLTAPLLGSSREFQALALGFPVGVGLVTFTLFLLSWAGITLAGGLLGIVTFGWLALAAAVARRSLGRWAASIAGALRDAARRLTAFHVVLLIVLAVAIGLSFTLAIGLSFYEDDEIAIWSTKGYGIALEGTVLAGATWGAHGLAYPLNIPLQIASFRMLAPDVIPISKAVFPLFYLCLLVAVLDFAVRRGIRPLHALLVVAFMATLPLLHFHSTLALANLPLAVYLVLGVFVTIEALLEPSTGKFVVAGVCLALAAWTRAEAILYVLSLMALFVLLGGLLRSERRRWAVAWAAPVIVGSLGWMAFAYTSVLASHLGNAVDAFASKAQMGEVGAKPLATIAENLFRYAAHQERWGGLMVLVALIALPVLLSGSFRSRPWSWWIVASGLVLALDVFLIFFVRSYSRADFDVLVRRAIHRHLLPAASLIFVGLYLAALPLASKVLSSQVVEAEQVRPGLGRAGDTRGQVPS